MRITAEAKRRNREKLLQAGSELFRSRGFDETTTREIAEAADMATGTVFNYFPAKEALAMAILDDAFERGQARFREGRRGGESLEEELFAHVAAELRELRPHQAFVGPVLQSAFSPFGGSALSRTGDDARLRHLEQVAEILQGHGYGLEDAAVPMHLYWTLYLGVLAYWSRDDSRGWQDTLAVLDQSMRLMVDALRPHARRGEHDGS